MYTHKTKSKGVGTRTNHPFQRSNNRTAIQFVDKRSTRAAQNALQLAMNLGQGVIQMGKDISDTVFYGYGEARQPFLARDRSVDQSMPHQTVDTLNVAIGLTDIASRFILMGEKRAIINRILSYDNNNNPENLTADELDWILWLRKNKNALLMPSMNGKQCREDMKMDNSWWAAFTNIVSPPINHNIKGRNNIIWRQGSHDENVENNRLQQIMAWNIFSRIAHNNFVNGTNDQYDNLYNNMQIAINDNIMFHNVKRLTEDWLGSNGDVMYRFWRLTSLMGLDFFAARNKHIVFIREEMQNDHNMHGRRAITDSEWGHAINQNYIQNGHVERVNPIANQQPNI